MESKVLCLLLLLFHSSWSQLECSGSEGIPVCNGTQFGLWESSIQGGPVITPDDSGEVIDYPISWIPDDAFAGGYSVVVREVNNQQAITILDPSEPDEFTIPQLRTGVEYEVMVCYDNVTELPTIDEFIAECGFCRTCFTAVPEFSMAIAPVFNRPESTVQEFPAGSEIQFIYRCEVTGVPPPAIRWSARNQGSTQQQPISADTDGIEIVTFPAEFNEVTSVLTILQGSTFSMPTCIAENSEDSQRLRPNEFRSISDVGTGSAPMFNLDDSTVQVFPDGSEIQFIYLCVAAGMPPPMIRWTARDRRTNQQEPISANTNGIEISTSSPESDTVTSELTILEGSNFDMPICVAENGAGSVELTASQFMESTLEQYMYL